MHVAKRIASLVVALLLLVAARNAKADAKEAMEQLKALSQSATAAYQDGDFEKARTQLTEAINLAKDNGLSANRIMAQIYILVGVLKINEHKDVEGGIKYFAKAIDISPAVKIPPTMMTCLIAWSVRKPSVSAGNVVAGPSLSISGKPSQLVPAVLRWQVLP